MGKSAIIVYWSCYMPWLCPKSCLNGVCQVFDPGSISLRLQTITYRLEMLVRILIDKYMNSKRKHWLSKKVLPASISSVCPCLVFILPEQNLIPSIFLLPRSLISGNFEVLWIFKSGTNKLTWVNYIFMGLLPGSCWRLVACGPLYPKAPMSSNSRHMNSIFFAGIKNFLL